MDARYDPAAALKTELTDIIAEFARLSPNLMHENDGEEVITVVCDSLKPEEFAEPHELDDWLKLKQKVGLRFAEWLSAGKQWKPLASMIVDENRYLYGSHSEFLRVVDLSVLTMPAEVAAYMVGLPKVQSMLHWKKPNKAVQRTRFARR